MAWELDPRDQKKIPLRSKENHNQRPKQKARPRRQGKATNRKLKKKKKTNEHEDQTKTKTKPTNLQWNAVGQVFYKTQPQKIKLAWSAIEVGAAFRVF